VSKTPLAASAANPPPPIDLDTAQLDQIAGARGQNNGDVYQFAVPRRDLIRESGMEIGPVGKCDFTKLNLNLIEKIEIDCHIVWSGPADSPAMRRRFAVQALLTSQYSSISRTARLWASMSCIFSLCPHRLYCCHRGALFCPSAAEAAR